MTNKMTRVACIHLTNYGHACMIIMCVGGGGGGRGCTREGRGQCARGLNA